MNMCDVCGQSPEKAKMDLEVKENTNKKRCVCGAIVKKTKSEKNSDYYRTRLGLCTHIYHNQVRSSKKRNHKPPTYSRLELYRWITTQPNFEQLYFNWFMSGYKKDLIPSVDRLESRYGYSFENIQLVTWKENFENYQKEMDARLQQIKPFV